MNNISFTHFICFQVWINESKEKSINQSSLQTFGLLWVAEGLLELVGSSLFLGIYKETNSYVANVVISKKIVLFKGSKLHNKFKGNIIEF